MRELKIYGPGPQGARHGANWLVESLPLRPINILRKNAILRRVDAQREKQGVGHVRLKAQGLGAAYHFEQLHHSLGAVHSAPTNLTLGRQSFAIAFGDPAGLAESV